MKNYLISYNDFSINKKHQKKVTYFIENLVKTYTLEKIHFKIDFRKMNNFGICFPSWKILQREVTIYINKDLLEETLFEELKGTLAHEFAHFVHIVNFSQADYLKFLFKAGNYTYSRKFSKAKINLFSNFIQTYEQYTDLTAYSFGFSKELISLKKYIPIYRKNLPEHLIPKSSNYLDDRFIAKLNKNSVKKELSLRYKKLNLKTLKGNP